nr:T cell receptor gamma 2 [Ictalurus punctatus]
MTMSNMTAACFLLVLIGCISAQFSHPGPWEIINRDRSKRMSCTVDSSVTLSSTALHWYRAKPGKALQRILYFAAGASTGTSENECLSRCNGGRKGNIFTLTITKVNDDDAATYYCALWRGDFPNEKVFSSGIRLYVTDGNTKVPKVSVYQVSRPQSNGKRVLLSQARGMFPDLVKFTWQAKGQGGETVEPKDDEQLEQRDEDQEVKITSMLIVDKQKVKTNTFICSVQHGVSNKQNVNTPQDEEKPDADPDPVPVKPCPTPKEKEQEEKEEEEEETPIHGVFELRRSLYLFTVTYVILLVKCVLYFCTVLLLLYKRNTANKEMLGSKTR